MKPRQRVRRHGYHLMSLASLGMVVAFGLWVVALAAASIIQGSKPVSADPMQSSFLLIVGMASVTLAAHWWALSSLRSVGKLLHAGELISPAMAGAWKRFANALVVVAVTMLLSIDVGQWQFGGPGFVALDTQELGLELDLTEAYCILVACLVSHSIAWILKDAADLKADNQGFV